MKLRLADCVGYVVEGAEGYTGEDGSRRMVKTPWDKKEIPFTEAAAFGTDRVIRDHATVGLVVTTDGSFGEIPRENFLEAEKKAISGTSEDRKAVPGAGKFGKTLRRRGGQGSVPD